MSKKYKTGLVIGKFLPFHRGHQYLIEEALLNTEFLVVVICQTEGYEIPADLRQSWIKKAFPEADVKIFHHEKYLDSVSTDLSKEWADITKDFLGYTPEVVFSSEEYGIEYAKQMGSKHVMVDKERIRYLISGTAIRDKTFSDRSWAMIDRNVREELALKVVVVGAESSGTSTLAEDLAKHFETAWTQEYGRFFAEGMLYVNDPNLWETRDFEHIAKMQNRFEDRLIRKCNKVLICDTDSWATSVWHLRYMGERSKAVEVLSAGRKVDLYIVTDVDIPFDQDGTRDGEHLRNWMHELFVNGLKDLKQNFIVVSGSREKRLNKSIKEIEKLLS